MLLKARQKVTEPTGRRIQSLVILQYPKTAGWSPMAVVTEIRSIEGKMRKRAHHIPLEFRRVDNMVTPLLLHEGVAEQRDVPPSVFSVGEYRPALLHTGRVPITGWVRLDIALPA